MTPIATFDAWVSRSAELPESVSDDAARMFDQLVSVWGQLRVCTWEAHPDGIGAGISMGDDISLLWDGALWIGGAPGRDLGTAIRSAFDGTYHFRGCRIRRRIRDTRHAMLGPLTDEKLNNTTDVGALPLDWPLSPVQWKESPYGK